MAPDRAKIKLLLICPWITSISGLRAALAAERLATEIVRVDFEAALRVALAYDRFHAAIYATTPGLTHEVVMSLVRQHAPRLPVLRGDELAGAAHQLADLLRDRRS